MEPTEENSKFPPIILEDPNLLCPFKVIVDFDDQSFKIFEKARHYETRGRRIAERNELAREGLALYSTRRNAEAYADWIGGMFADEEVSREQLDAMWKRYLHGSVEDYTNAFSRKYSLEGIPLIPEEYFPRQRQGSSSNSPVEPAILKLQLIAARIQQSGVDNIKESRKNRRKGGPAPKEQILGRSRDKDREFLHPPKIPKALPEGYRRLVFSKLVLQSNDPFVKTIDYPGTRINGRPGSGMQVPGNWKELVGDPGNYLVSMGIASGAIQPLEAPPGFLYVERDGFLEGDCEGKILRVVDAKVFSVDELRDPREKCL